MRFHFDCVFYYVSDLNRAIKFYSGFLGFKLMSQDVVARFDIDGVLFELVPAPDKSKFQGRGNARLCLKVNDIHQISDDLKNRGIPMNAIQYVDNGMLASFYDPDGNELCLWQYC